MYVLCRLCYIVPPSHIHIPYRRVHKRYWQTRHVYTFLARLGLIHRVHTSLQTWSVTPRLQRIHIPDKLDAHIYQLKRASISLRLAFWNSHHTRKVSSYRRAIIHAKCHHTEEPSYTQRAIHATSYHTHSGTSEGFLFNGSDTPEYVLCMLSCVLFVCLLCSFLCMFCLYVLFVCSVCMFCLYVMFVCFVVLAHMRRCVHYSVYF